MKRFVIFHKKKQTLIYKKKNKLTVFRCVHMVLKALGEPFVEKKLDLFKGEHKSPEFLKINPEGKVPAIKHGNFSLGER